MRFSTLALFVALPATAYAVVFPRDQCVPRGQFCNYNTPGAPSCCQVEGSEPVTCQPLTLPIVVEGEDLGVCPSAYALILTDRDVRVA